MSPVSAHDHLVFFLMRQRTPLHVSVWGFSFSVLKILPLFSLFPLDVSPFTAYFFGMIPIFQTLATIPRRMMKELAPGWGRAQDTETRYLLGNPDRVEQAKGTERFFELSLTPYIFAGLRYRDISRLWVSAHGLDKDDNGAYAPAQIIFPPYAMAGDDNLLRFVQWQFDERLARGMKSVIQQMQYSCLTYGRSIQEIDWQYQDGGEYAGKVIINDIWDRDPDRFIINPKGYKPGLYLKRSVFSSTVDESDLLPPHKFVVLTNRKYFENQYGISELRPLDNVSAILSQIWGFWARGLEKAGKGALIGKYSSKLLGKGNEQARADFLAEVAKIANETVTITHIDNIIETLKPEFEATAFSEFVQTAVSQISLVLTGSSTALIEGKFGSYSKEESTTVRQKSDIEQLDAAAISEAFNFQIIPWLTDYNFADVQSYPTMYLIQPERITPTTPKDQAQTQEPVDIPPDAVDSLPTPKLFDAVLFADGGDSPSPSADSAGENATGNLNETATSTPQPVTSFFPAPEIYGDAAVKLAAKNYAGSLTALVDTKFDKLTPAEKQRAFTIAGIGDRPGMEKVLDRLKNEIAATLDEPDEETAFYRYYPKARAILRGSGATVLSPSELLVSFRVTRQKAYSQGVMQYAEANKEQMHGLQWRTQEDPQVRAHHKAWHNVLRPIDDPIWREWFPPVDFNCRCYLQPITKEQAAKEPDKYAYTAKLPRQRDAF